MLNIVFLRRNVSLNYSNPGGAGKCCPSLELIWKQRMSHWKAVSGREYAIFTACVLICMTGQERLGIQIRLQASYVSTCVSVRLSIPAGILR